MKKLFSLVLGMLGLTILLFTCNFDVNAVSANTIVRDGKTFEKVNTQEQLSAGNYIIAAQSEDTYLGSFHSKYYYNKTVDVETAVIFTLEAKDTGYTLLNTMSGNYAYHSGKNNVYEGTVDKAATFEITVTNGISTIKETTTNRVLKYNKSASRFALYTGGQLDIELFKENTSGEVLKEFNVSFNTMGGEVLQSIVGYEGKTLTDLPVPTKVGFKFAGWYKEETLTNAWNLETDVVTSDITLYAKWETSNLEQITTETEVVSAKYVIKSGDYYLGKFAASEFSATLNENEALELTVQKSGANYIISFDDNGVTKYLGTSTKSSINEVTDKAQAYKSSISLVEGTTNYEFNIMLNTNRRIAFKTDAFKAYSTADTSGSVPVELFKVKGSEMLDETTFVDSFVSEKTSASLKIKYNSETFVATDVDLRFGSKIKAESFDSNAKYGVMLVRKDANINFVSGQQNVNSAAEFVNLNNGVKNLEATNIARVDANGNEDINGAYYQFAWVVNNMETVGYDTELIAVSYVETNGSLYFAQCTNHSVKTVANIYLADANISANQELVKVFENIIKG